MARASSHEQGLAPQEWGKVRATEASSPSEKLVVREGKNELTRAGTCTTGTRWSCGERSSSEQRQNLWACYLQEQNLGIWECHVHEQLAVLRWGLEEEVLSGEQGRYWTIGGVGD